MDTTFINTRIMQKHALEADWLNSPDFIPLQGEIIVYDKEISPDGTISPLPSDRSMPFSYSRFKIGDGNTSLLNLPFSTDHLEDFIVKKELEIYSALNELAGTGRTTETIKSNSDRIDDIDSSVLDLEQDVEALIEKSEGIETSVANIEVLAKGATKAVTFDNYESMISDLKAAENDKYLKGQNILIVTLNVPDLWISYVEDTFVDFTYTDDSAIIDLLSVDGAFQVGYYKVSRLETLKVDLSNYVQKEEGKGLSSANFTVDEKLKLASIEEGAQKNPISDNNLLHCGEDLTIDSGSKNSVIFGSTNTLAGHKDIIGGGNNTVTNTDLALVVGSENNVVGDANIIGGRSNQVNASRSNLVVGFGNRAGDVTPINPDSDLPSSGSSYNDGTFDGAESNAIGNNLLAGRYNTVKGNNNIVAGIGNLCTNDDTIVAGKYANVTSDTVLAIGNGSSAAPSNIFEVKSSGSAYLNSNKVAVTSDLDAYVLKDGKKVLSTYDFNDTYKTYLDGELSSPSISSTGSIIAGKNNAGASTNNTAVFGFNNQDTAGHNVIGGKDNIVSKDLNIVGGQSNTVSGVGNIVGGRYSNSQGITSRGNLVVGMYNNVTGSDADACGSNLVGGHGNTIHGGESGNLGTDNVVVGSGNNIYSSKSAVVGNNNTVEAQAHSSITAGSNTVTKGSNSLTIGRLVSTDRNSITVDNHDYTPTMTKENNSVAIGGGVQALAEWSFAQGYATVSTEKSQFVVGRYNVLTRANEEDMNADNPTQLFIVGNGNINQRSNAFHVTQDGQAYVNNTQRLATEDYVKAQDEIVASIAKGANNSLVYKNYKELIDDFNFKYDLDDYRVGQNVLIEALNVPDLWIEYISDNRWEYPYESEEAVAYELSQNGSINVGGVIFAMLETQKVDLSEYVTNQTLDNHLENCVDKTQLLEELSGYVTDESLANDLLNYVVKDGDKVLSDANFTVAEKAKLAGISSTITGVDTSLWNITNTATIKVGPGHTIPGTISHAAVFGYYNTLEEGAWRTIVGGANNKLTGMAGLSIVGGKYNYVDCKTMTTGASASIVGGQANGVNGLHNVVGGYKNLLGCTVTYDASGAPTYTPDNTSVVNHAAVFGNENKIAGSAWRVIVGGAYNTVTAKGALSLVQGHTNTSDGRGAFICGENNIAGADYSTCLGRFNISNNKGQVLTGICSEPSANSLFTIGNGSYVENLDSAGEVISVDTNRSNAFEVVNDPEGVAIIVGNTKITENQLKQLLTLLDHVTIDEENNTIAWK